MAVRVALGETQLVQEVRRFLLDNGVCLDSFSQVGALGDADLNIRGRGQGLEGWVCQRRSLLTLQLSVKVRKIIGRLLACPFGLYSLWNSLGQNTAVGSSLSLLQGILPSQGSNPGLLHCRWILYQLSHRGSPRILEWVAYPFSRGSSWPRNRTRVSCIARWILYQLSCQGGPYTGWVGALSILHPVSPLPH